jgi:hypothetical protein
MTNDPDPPASRKEEVEEERGKIIILPVRKIIS